MIKVKKCKKCGTIENLHTTTIKGKTYVCNICQDCYVNNSKEWRQKQLNGYKAESFTIKYCKYCGTTEDLKTITIKNQFMEETKTVIQNVCNTCFGKQISERTKGKSKSEETKQKLKEASLKWLEDPENKRKQIESRGLDYEDFLKRQEESKLPKTCKYCGTTENLITRSIENRLTKEIKIIQYTICRECYLKYHSGENNPFFGKKHSEETKQKARDYIKNWYYNTEEGIICRQEKSIASKKWAEEHREELLRYSLKGCHSQRKISSIETRLANVLKW